MQNTTTFSIEANINPKTDKPFGNKYTGTFSIRRPTLQDKTLIALRCAADLSVAGGNGVNMVTDEILDANYVFAQLSVIKEADLPEWFDRSKIYEEDEPAVQEVASEVRKFINSFRCPDNGGNGKPAGQDTPVVVP